jgi:Flp pilus assembly protein TadG
MKQPNCERGFVLVWVTLGLTVLLGCAGLAVDIGRMYLGKSEVQEFCDAAALSAAVSLNGTASGITNARSAVTGSLNQPWSLGPDQIGTPQVEFATASNGPWTANPANPAGYTYARITASMPVRLFFLRALVGRSAGTVAASAVGAQVAQTSFSQGLDPYTAVATDLNSPNLGFVVGNHYDIQWPNYNGNRAGCGPANPLRCFNSPPCAGDSNTSALAVVQHWASSTSGYWGSTSNSEIALEILNVIQLQPITLGQPVALTAGNKASEAKYLDQRVNQDQDVTDNTVSAYLSNASRNGRRLIAIPIVNPTPTGTTVVGFGAFLLLSNGSSSNLYTSGDGNDPFCAAYVGPYVVGSPSAGGSGRAGAYKVLLVQ